LEIVLWDRVDARLRKEHDLPLAFFESLYFIGRAPGGSLRVGELAKALGITVGGASKVVDRIERAGLVLRSTDGDRRASRISLTESGARSLEAAESSYEKELDLVLNASLTALQQQQMHDLARLLLDSNTPGEV
jgi:DNA-binding MarR family transcriptional regulator